MGGNFSGRALPREAWRASACGYELPVMRYLDRYCLERQFKFIRDDCTLVAYQIKLHFLSADFLWLR